MLMLFFAWLSPALILCAGGAFFAGANRWNEDETITWFVLAALWPIVLAVILICGPFVLLHRLGRLVTQRQMERADG